jgi:hypothetical protein
MSKLFQISQRTVLRPLAPWALAIAALAGAPAYAVTFAEVGDAGKTLGSVQITSGAPGMLTAITGGLGSTFDADLYLINITNPAAFSASTLAAPNTTDTQLFLFTLAGAPVYANDDAPDGTSTGSFLTAGSSLGPTTAGLYILGVSMGGYSPVNVNAQFLFSQDGLSTDIKGPSSGLSPTTLGGWDGQGGDLPAAYSIQLTGAAVAAIPEPSTALMFLAAGALGLAVRRKRFAAAARTGA